MRKLQKLAAGVLETVLAGTALHQALPQGLQQLHTPGERGALHDWGHGCGHCPACALRAAGYREWRGVA